MRKSKAQLEFEMKLKAEKIKVVRDIMFGYPDGHPERKKMITQIKEMENGQQTEN